jgi:hypothetical protein
MRARPPALTVLPRRAVLGLLLAVASCASEPAPSPVAGSFAPLDFSYLLPLRLNVARVEVVQHYVPSGQPPDVSPLDPVQPVAALRLMAEQRLKAEGSSGRAVFVINDASLLRLGDLITGTLSVELDIFPSDDVRAGFAQATVVRQLTGAAGDLSAALYQFTRDMMDQMNVEFEYQVRHSLAQWLLPEGAVPAAVEAAPLSGEPPGPPPPAPFAAPPTSPLAPPPTPLAPGAPVPLQPPPPTG